MHSPAISLSPYKMLAGGQQCSKVVQFPVSRMLWANCPRNIYCFAFCSLVTGHLCVLHLWHPVHLCWVCSSQAAGQRALPKWTCKTKGQWKIQEGQSLSSSVPLWKTFSCGKRRFRSWSPHTAISSSPGAKGLRLQSCVWEKGIWVSGRQDKSVCGSRRHLLKHAAVSLNACYSCLKTWRQKRNMVEIWRTTVYANAFRQDAEVGR